MTEYELSQEIFSRFGSVTRARACFLYTKKQVRLTDLFQADGRAILGWGGGNSVTKFKNILNRGITGQFKTEISPQLKKAVSTLLNCDLEIFTYSSLTDALKTSLLFSPENSFVWKPWNDSSINLCNESEKFESCVLVPPFPWTNNFFITAVKKSVFDSSNVDSINLCSAQTFFPAPLLGATARSIYDLIDAQKNRSEKDWFGYDTVLTKFFKRKGPYLYPKVKKENYDDFIHFCLDCEIVINPNFEKPSIVPFGADKGVFTKLKNNMKGESFYATI